MAFDLEKFLEKPLEDRTYEECLSAVKHYGEYIKYVPDAYKTEDICLCAIRQYAYVIAYIPEAIRTPAICIEVCRCNLDLMCYTPKKFITKEFIQLILDEDSENYFSKYIPEELRMFV
jgi:hypothetical protein